MKYALADEQSFEHHLVCGASTVYINLVTNLDRNNVPEEERVSIESKYGKDLGELRAVVARKPALSSRKIAFLLATEFGWHKKYGWPRTRDEGDPKNRIVALCEREGIALPLETGAQRKGPPKPPRAKAIGRGATLPPLASLQE